MAFSFFETNVLCHFFHGLYVCLRRNYCMTDLHKDLLLASRVQCNRLFRNNKDLSWLLSFYILTPISSFVTQSCPPLTSLNYLFYRSLRKNARKNIISVPSSFIKHRQHWEFYLIWALSAIKTISTRIDGLLSPWLTAQRSFSTGPMIFLPPAKNKTKFRQKNLCSVSLLGADASTCPTYAE